MDRATVDSLAAAYRDGRTESLPPLVQGLARVLLAQAFRFLRDWDLAADLVQEAWLLAVETIERYDPARPFLPWLQTILRHRCLQHLAREARRPTPVSLTAVGDQASQQPEHQPDLVADRADLRRHLARQLKTLPATQRQAVMMVDLEQRSHRETAAALEITPASLRVILHRGRRGLAHRLRKEELS